MSPLSFSPFGLVKSRRRSPFGSARLPRRTVVAHVLLVSILAGSVLALGSFYASTLAFSTVGLAVACTLAWWPREPRRLRTAAKLVLAVAVALPAFTLLQCIPLPLAWVDALAPANADVWGRALRPLHEAAPRFATISLDPTNTRVEVLRGVTYLLAFLATLRLSARRGGATLFCSAIALTGGALALVTVFHVVLDADTVFGIYKPLTPVAHRNIGPLLNPNHLAAYLNIALCLALGLAFNTEEQLVRLAGVALIVGLGAMQVWVGSRAGVVLMVFAIPFVALLSHLRSGTGALVRGRRFVVGGVVALAVAGMLVLALSTRSVAELTTTDVSKFTVALDTLKLVKGHALFGIGRGAFESAYPSVESLHGYWTYTHPENVVAQWAIEWGLPVSVLCFGALVFAFRPNTYATASQVAAGPWAALIITAIHNLADFNSEMPGVGIALATCAGVVVASRPRGDQALTPTRRWPRWVALLSAAAVLPILLLVAPTFGHDLLHDRNTLHDAVEDRSVARAPFLAEVRGAILRHPGERYFPYLGALRAARDGENPIPWIDLALERSPTYGRAHLLLADALAARAPAQARLEYRFAMADDPNQLETVIPRAVRVVSNLPSALELVPPEPLALPALEALVSTLGVRLPATAAAMNERILRANSSAPAANLRAVRAARIDIDSGDSAPWCSSARDACVAGALELAARAVRAAPTECEAHTEQARIVWQSGHSQEGLDLLKKAIDGVTDRAGCLRTLASLAAFVHNGAMAEFALDRLVHACTTTEECVAFEIEAAETEERLGHTGLALARFRRVLARAPEHKDIAARVAVLSSKLDLAPAPEPPPSVPPPARPGLLVP